MKFKEDKGVNTNFETLIKSIKPAQKPKEWLREKKAKELLRLQNGLVISKNKEVPKYELKSTLKRALLQMMDICKNLPLKILIKLNK